MGTRFIVIEKRQYVPPDNLGTKFQEAEVERFIVDTIMSLGVCRANATAIAQVLVAADVRGHYSHGLSRLDMYVNDIRKNLCDGGAAPTIVKESVSTALVDGNNGLGPVVGNFCMDLAIKKARATGIGWVCAKGSNHFGIAGWYTTRATKQGLLGMSFTNTSAVVVPTRGKEGIMGTNPLSLAAPAKGDDNFMLDMATSVVALGKVKIAQVKNETIPKGWAMDELGNMVTNPAACLSKTAKTLLMPLGGTEQHSGYKGFGLGMLVEIFCGIMTGGPYGHQIRDWSRADRQADISHCFVAIDPAFFAPGFEDRMSDLINHCRNMEPVDKSKAVLVAGDPERISAKKVKEEGGITYHLNQAKDSWQLAQYLGVTPMQSV